MSERKHKPPHDTSSDGTLGGFDQDGAWQPVIVDGHPRRLTPAEAIQHGQHLVGDIESSGVTSRDETWHAVARFFDGAVEEAGNGVPRLVAAGHP